MKTIKNIALIAFVSLLAFTACKKENDFGGKASIKGTVTLNGTPVSNAFVYLSLGATEPSTTRDASAVTDASGAYKFSGLLTGDYFVTAEYTNSTGQTFKSGGGKVKIGDKKGEVTADLTVQ
ncbi:MAG TPA: carboxypeptidase-like regulatory domain-containing protein [Bacteroidia bacterium]|nr:carboxypeptidase-like regulatory domain-containing protein [Bacteroidia bacterium]